GIVQRRGIEPGNMILLLVALFDRLIVLLCVATAVLAQLRQTGRGKFRVEIDLAAVDRVENHRIRAERGLLDDSEAGMPEQEHIHLGQQLGLGIQLTADGQRNRRIRWSTSSPTVAGGRAAASGEY